MCVDICCLAVLLLLVVGVSADLDRSGDAIRLVCCLQLFLAAKILQLSCGLLMILCVVRNTDDSSSLPPAYSAQALVHANLHNYHSCPSITAICTATCDGFGGNGWQTGRVVWQQPIHLMTCYCTCTRMCITIHALISMPSIGPRYFRGGISNINNISISAHLFCTCPNPSAKTLQSPHAVAEQA
jgi:hypothetical protein